MDFRRNHIGSSGCLISGIHNSSGTKFAFAIDQLIFQLNLQITENIQWNIKPIFSIPELLLKYSKPTEEKGIHIVSFDEMSTKPENTNCLSELWRDHHEKSGIISGFWLGTEYSFKDKFNDLNN